MDLKSFTQSLMRGELLVPHLKKFLRIKAKLESIPLFGGLYHKKFVISDAKMTVDCFKARIGAYKETIEEDFEYFHPSQLGSCFRASWFDRHNAPRKKEEDGEATRSHLTFEIGTYLHVMFQNLCQHAGVLKKREVGIKDKKLRILGHADGVVNLREDYLLEIKTSNSNGFIRLTQPHESHKKQVTAYMKSLSLERALIVYIDKDRSQLKEFAFPYEEKFYQAHVKDRIAYYFETVEMKTPPEREGSNPNLPPCRYCPFQEICFDTLQLKQWQRTKDENKTR